jgi:hypothetical protein
LLIGRYIYVDIETLLFTSCGKVHEKPNPLTPFPPPPAPSYEEGEKDEAFFSRKGEKSKPLSRVGERFGERFSTSREK